MAKRVLDGFQIACRGEYARSRCVAQIMEPEIRDAGLFQYFFQGLRRLLVALVVAGNRFDEFATLTDTAHRLHDRQP